MSLVGPRPLPCDETEACRGWLRQRLDVTPGLTCIWQVQGRSIGLFRRLGPHGRAVYPLPLARRRYEALVANRAGGHVAKGGVVIVAAKMCPARLRVNRHFGPENVSIRPAHSEEPERPMATDVAQEPERRPRVLQLSYACSPLRGSEAGVGWHRAVQSAQHFDTWVICEEHEFAGEVRGYLEVARRYPRPQLRVCADRPAGVGVGTDPRFRVVRRLCAVGIAAPIRWPGACTSSSVSIWSIRSRFAATASRAICGSCPFRSYGVRSAARRTIPGGFLPAAGLRGALHETCRNLMNNLQLRLSPRVRNATRKAASSWPPTPASSASSPALTVLPRRCCSKRGLARWTDAPRPGDPRSASAANSLVRHIWSIARRCTC